MIWVKIKYWIAAILTFPFLLLISFIVALINTVLEVREAVKECVYEEVDMRNRRAG